MKKQILATVVAAVFSTSAMAWDSAGQTRDNLETVYNQLGAANGFNTAGPNGQGAQAFSELLFRIDHMGEGSVDLTWDSSSNSFSYETTDAGYTIAEVVSQVDTFVDGVQKDLFGVATDVTGNAITDNFETFGAAANSDTYNAAARGGLFTNRVDGLVAIVSSANTAIVAAETKADAQAIIDHFGPTGGTVSQVHTGTLAGISADDNIVSLLADTNAAIATVSTFDTALRGHASQWENGDRSTLRFFDLASSTADSITAGVDGDVTIRQGADTYGSYNDYVNND